MEVLGVLSGIGHLPVEVARSAKSLGYEVVAVGVVPDIDPELAESVDKYYDINIGKIGKIISTLKKHKVTRVTMIGKVTKEVLYKAGAIVPDLRAIKILASVDLPLPLWPVITTISLSCTVKEMSSRIFFFLPFSFTS